MKLLVLTVLSVLAASSLPGSTACSCSFPWKHYNGNCYRFYANKVDWQTAQNNCEGQGANLVSIHDEAENAFAYALVITTGCNAPTGEDAYAWIGYAQQPSSSPFAWSDGSADDYTNWASNQPDNYNHGYATEDCGHFRTDPSGSWNDFPCNKQIGYICKKSA